MLFLRSDQTHVGKAMYHGLNSNKKEPNLSPNFGLFGAMPHASDSQIGDKTELSIPLFSITAIISSLHLIFLIIICMFFGTFFL